MESAPLEVHPYEVKQRLAAGEGVRLIDVREPHEHAICRIDGAELIPMRSIPGVLAALKEQAAGGTLVFYCHHGVRSLKAVEWLRQQGLARCQSLHGGIDLWAAAVDPRLPRY
jgi:rhodanese-related sulfurtransferase